MSEDPRIAVALAAIAAMNAGDLDQLLEMVDPDVEFPSIEARISGEGSTGRDAMRRWWRDLRAAWDVFELTPQRLEVVGDALLVEHDRRVRARSSGVAMTDHLWLVLWFSAELLIRRIQTSENEASARKAALA